MQIVQDDRQRPRVRVQPVQQLIDGQLDDHAWHSQAHKRRASDAFRYPVDGARHICPQAHGVRVGLIDRDPRNRTRLLRAPGPQQHRLAVPNRRVDKGQRRHMVAVKR
jgi:hypothetical protein